MRTQLSRRRGNARRPPICKKPPPPPPLPGGTLLAWILHPLPELWYLVVLLTLNHPTEPDTPFAHITFTVDPTWTTPTPEDQPNHSSAEYHTGGDTDPGYPTVTAHVTWPSGTTTQIVGTATPPP